MKYIEVYAIPINTNKQKKEKITAKNTWSIII